MVLPTHITTDDGDRAISDIVVKADGSVVVELEGGDLAYFADIHALMPVKARRSYPHMMSAVWQKLLRGIKK